MQIKLKTNELKDVVNKVVKGMGNNKILPITEMIGVNVSNNELSLVSTDGSSSIQVTIPIDNVETSVSFVVSGKQFSQLIQKTTTEFTTLVFEDNKVIVKGNGNYAFTCVVDEDGNLVTLNNIEKEYQDSFELNVNDLKKAYEINKFSLAKTMETPAYTGFYFDENGAVSTDSIKISYINCKLFPSPVLLNSRFMNLVMLLAGDKAKVHQTNSDIIIESDNVLLQGSKMTDVVDFPIEDIKPFIESELPHKVRVNKKSLLNLLDRISVFVTPFDKNSIKIDFTNDGARVWTLNGVNNELIPYIDKENLEESSIQVDVTSFKDLVSADPDEDITIMYGHPAAIKLSFGNVSQVLALVGD